MIPSTSFKSPFSVVFGKWTLLFLLFISVSLGLTSLKAQPLPADSGYINVKDAAYGAIGNGIADDTAAIKAAIVAALSSGSSGSDRTNNTRVVYFPAGTYLISDSLESRVGTTGTFYGWRAGLILWGEDRATAIIQLAPSSVGFTTIATPKAMIKTGTENPTSADGGGNLQGFRHSVINLTLDTGTGNSGAMGIDYLANNRGVIEQVTIRSGDPGKAGYSGIKMTREGPGPAEINNVEIDGFNYGVVLGQFEPSMTAEKITVKNQLISGIYQSNNALWIRGLTSVNTVPAYTSTGVAANGTIIDGNFSGGLNANAAIVSKGFLLARNLTSSGYGKVIDNFVGTGPDVVAGAGVTTVAEWTSHAVKSEFSTPLQSLNLPIEDTPTYHNADFGQWANAVTYGATGTGVGDGNDDAPAIQAAIDSGKEIVYLPNGRYSVSRPIIIRNNVRKIMGVESVIGQNANFTGEATFIFEDAAPAAVVLEHLIIGGTPAVIHKSSRAISFRHMNMAGGFKNDTILGNGKAFFEDVESAKIFLYGSIKVWMRQINTEDLNSTQIENHGATLWILGQKVETTFSVNLTDQGGKSEILGAFNLGSQGQSSIPIFINNDANVAISYRMQRTAYPNIVRETRDGVTSTFTTSESYTGGYAGSVAPLYVGYQTGISAPAAPAGLAATSVNGNRVDLVWTDSSANEKGFAIERSKGIFATKGVYEQIAVLPAGTTTYSDTSVKDVTKYYYRVRAFNVGGQSVTSNEATATTPYAILSGALLYDKFNDGARSAGADPYDTAWYLTSVTNVSATIVNDAPFERPSLGVSDLKTGTSGRGVVRGLIAPFTPVTLANTGDYVRAVVTFRINNNPTTYFGNHLNLGLYDSGATPATADGTTNTGDDKGYFAYIPYGVANAGGSGNASLRREAGGVSSINLGTDVSTLASASPTWNSLRDTSIRTATLTLTRTGATQISTSITSGGLTITGALDNAPVGYLFNELSLTIDGDKQDFVVSDVQITSNVVIVPPTPTAPSGLAATAVSSSQINLAWTDNSTNETGFKIERKTGAGGSYSQIATPAANTTSYSDSTGLSAATLYYYRILATNLGSDSAFSTEASAATDGIAPAMTLQPVNQSVAAGQTATFLAGASGTPSPTFQWKLNGANISGATSNSYTTSATIAADDGNSYTLVATNSAGTFTSNAAILSIRAQTLTEWRGSYFSPADLADPAKEATVWGNSADPDGDGLANLLEYATNTSPTVNTAPSPVIMTNESDHLVLSFTRLNPAMVDYEVEASSDLVTWTSIAALSAVNTTWTGTATVTETGAVATRAVKVTDALLLSANPSRYLRMKVSVFPDTFASYPDVPFLKFPSGDSFVRDGTGYATTNYGTLPNLTVKKDGTPYNRETFVKFDISALATDLPNAKLVISVIARNTVAPTHYLIKCLSSWTETGVIWNNRPATVGSVLANWVPILNTDVVVDVTSAIQAARLAGETEISFKVYSTTSNSTSNADYASRENSAVNLRPTLEITLW